MHLLHPRVRSLRSRQSSALASRCAAVLIVLGRILHRAPSAAAAFGVELSGSSAYVVQKNRVTLSLNFLVSVLLPNSTGVAGFVVAWPFFSKCPRSVLGGDDDDESNTNPPSAFPDPNPKKNPKPMASRGSRTPSQQARGGGGGVGSRSVLRGGSTCHSRF